MNPAAILHRARDAGVDVSVAAGDLVLEAATAPPAQIIELLRAHKDEIVLKLSRAQPEAPQPTGVWSAEEWSGYYGERAAVAQYDQGLPQAEAEALAFRCCVSEWLWQTAAPSRPGICASCGERSSEGSLVKPFGTEVSGHVWLHSNCWDVWRARRERDAEDALRAIGIPSPVDRGALS